MNHTLVATIASLSLFAGVFLFSYFSYRIGKIRRHLVESSESTGAIIGAIFALLGLLIAFTFSGAYTRLDARRQLVVQEANAIGTAYLRLDLLSKEAQGPLRDDFKKYTLSRAAFFDKLIDRNAAIAELAKTTTLQQDMWARAVAASSGPENNSARMLLIPALNEMFDIVTTRTNAVQTHPPALIFISLSIIALACASMTGYRAGISGDSPPRYITLAFAMVIAFIVYLILDIEYPRYGFIRLDEVNKLIVDQLQSMK